MEFLTTEEAKSWCVARGLRITVGRYLHFEPENLQCFTVGLEERPSRVIALAEYLVPTWADTPYEGALVWIRERGIGGDHSEKIGETVIRQMRIAQGENVPLEGRPGHLFGSKEFVEMHCYFVIPLLFGWDVFLVPENQDYFVFASHDGVAAVVTRTAHKADELSARLRSWNPREDEGWYSRIASR